MAEKKEKENKESSGTENAAEKQTELQSSDVNEEPVKEPPAESSVESEPEKSSNKEDKLKRVNKILTFVVPVLILLLALSLWYLFTFNWNQWEAHRETQTTDNATVETDIIPLSTRAVGTIETVNIKDFQKVKAGDVLVTLRSQDVQASVKQATAGINSSREALNNIQIQKQQHEDRIRQAQTGVDVAFADIDSAQIALNSVQNDLTAAQAAIETAREEVRTAESGIEAVNADLERSTSERKRQENLFAAQATTKQRLEAVVAENEKAIAAFKARNLDKAKAQNLVKIREQDLQKAQNLQRIRQQDLRKAQNQLKVRQNDLAIALKQRDLLDGQERQLQEDLKAKEANLVIANTNLDYTRIVAPRDGVVGEVKVKPGQQLAPGAQVASLVSEDLWIIANFKETQIAAMREGDAVEIVIDAFSGSTLKGQVAEIAPASGAQFSAIPPENASGSYTRVTQRVPVKIVFDADSGIREKLRPGMSATVSVKIEK